MRKRSDSEWVEKASRWHQVKAELDKWKAEEEALREELIRLAGDESAAGGGIKLVKSERKGLVDYQQIPELEGVNLEKYRKPSMVSWRLTAFDFQ